MRQFRVDIGVIGVSSIEPDGTLLDYDYREVRVAQAIIEQSREVWLVADHSKFARGAMIRLGHVSQVDRFFTDGPVPEPVAQLLPLQPEKGGCSVERKFEVSSGIPLLGGVIASFAGSEVEQKLEKEFGILKSLA